MITTKSIDVLLKGVRAEFWVAIDQAEKQLSSYNTNVYLDATNKTGPLFEEISATGRQRAEFIQVTGVQELQPTAEAQEFIAADYVPSFITTVEPYKFTRRIKVTRESAERRDTMYQKALNEATKLNVASENTKARHRFSRLNNSTSVATQAELFDYGDGVALFSASHPDKQGSVHSNIATSGVISKTSVEATVLVLQNQVDDIGEPMPMGGGKNWLVVPPALVRLAKEQIDSEWAINTANNNINVWYGGQFALATSPFLSATNGGSDVVWYVVDGMFSPLVDVNFRAVTNETWFDENTKVFVHDISMEHKVGAKDYRGIVRNAGV